MPLAPHTHVTHWHHDPSDVILIQAKQRYGDLDCEFFAYVHGTKSPEPVVHTEPMPLSVALKVLSYVDMYYDQMRRDR